MAAPHTGGPAARERPGPWRPGAVPGRVLSLPGTHLRAPGSPRPLLLPFARRSEERDDGRPKGMAREGRARPVPRPPARLPLVGRPARGAALRLPVRGQGPGREAGDDPHRDDRGHRRRGPVRAAPAALRPGRPATAPAPEAGTVHGLAADWFRAGAVALVAGHAGPAGPRLPRADRSALRRRPARGPRHGRRLRRGRRELIGAGHGRRAVETAVQTLRAMLAVALDAGMIPTNPAAQGAPAPGAAGRADGGRSGARPPRRRAPRRGGLGRAPGDDPARRARGGLRRGEVCRAHLARRAARGAPARRPPGRLPERDGGQGRAPAEGGQRRQGGDLADARRAAGGLVRATQSSRAAPTPPAGSGRAGTAAR